MNNAPWLKGLNPRQAEAVTHGREPLLILAGAGSGKTRVITCRIAWLIAEMGLSPRSILAVTFTNKAAREMRERAAALVPEARDCMIRTFHSFGAWLLRRNSAAAGLSPNFTIYDDDDQVGLLGQVLPGMSRRDLKSWGRMISRAKDEGLVPENDLSDFTRNPEFPKIYTQYEERLRNIGNVDFGDLILQPTKLLESNPPIRQRMTRRFQVILVDEYQDTNIAQYHLLRELTGEETWLCVVGDDDQSIYRFRGAKVENIISFPEMFPGTNVVKLEQNYRSSASILEIASAVVSKNNKRMGKTLWTNRPSGKIPIVVLLEDHEHEAEWCANRVDADGKFGETAILYRTNAQSRIFESVFRRRNIPYRIVGTLSFYQREEIKDLMAYLSWLANNRDEIAFRRIANKPPRGLGKVSLDKLMVLAIREYSGDILSTCHSSPSEIKGDRTGKAVQFFTHLAARYRDRETPFEHLGMMIADIGDFTELFKHYQEVDKQEHSQRMDNLQELVNAAADFPDSPEGLTAFLEMVGLNEAILGDEPEDDNRVTLITMHNTKGLEFERVFITGMEEGLFPRDTPDVSLDDLEEERRLFYVAITRARHELAFTLCQHRMMWGNFRTTIPSRFLHEIPPDAIKEEGMGSLTVVSRSGNTPDPWQPGVRLYHDDYGVGIVYKRISKGGHITLHIGFESGKRAVVMPEFSAHKLEYLGVAE